VEYDHFLRQVCPLLGLKWRKYRRRSARHRINQRIQELGLADYASYLGRLKEDSREAAGLADLMRVTVSRFFRDRACWSQLTARVLPELLAEKTSDKTVRVWSAGCCGGEEPYSMALVWLEYLQPLFPDFTIEIFATDIDEPSLARARRGLYDTASLRELPREIVDAYFSRNNGRWLVDDRVKEPVRFLKHNLVLDPAPSGMDLVLCRYLVFTYYGGNRLLAAAMRLHEALRPGGVLMTGRSETLDAAVSSLFDSWPGSACMYRKSGRSWSRQ
jgi:chemotaxis methyl-accepting protein methylase